MKKDFATETTCMEERKKQIRKSPCNAMQWHLSFISFMFTRYEKKTKHTYRTKCLKSIKCTSKWLLFLAILTRCTVIAIAMTMAGVVVCRYFFFLVCVTTQMDSSNRTTNDIKLCVRWYTRYTIKHIWFSYISMVLQYISMVYNQFKIIC